ncbi:MAG: glycoside hydrolase family 5 protein [Candidatus Marinimicrobia bacterium]|nr:glycoside hydrolase family 5 protein [Candidatus Neomarinimicrobiota bacterium]
MKTKILISTMIIVLSLTSCEKGFVETNGQLQVKGVQLVNRTGDPIVLRGLSYGWHNWWPRFYNEGTVKWLKEDWKVTVVRTALGVGVNSENAYFQNPDFSLEKIEAVINGAINEDIYVIIDWHSHQIFREEAVDFFSKMAKKYGHHPHIIYEIFNEPVHNSWEEVKAYSMEIIQAIRQFDPDNIILVGSPHWDQDVHLAADDPLTGFDNIMYSLHFYARTHKQWLRERGDYALAKGLPLFVSECASMEASGDGPLDFAEFDAWIDWMEKHKISWVTWSLADKDESCSVLYPSSASDGNWNEEDLKESGKLNREKFRVYNP